MSDIRYFVDTVNNRPRYRGANVGWVNPGTPFQIDVERERPSRGLVECDAQGRPVAKPKALPAVQAPKPEGAMPATMPGLTPGMKPVTGRAVVAPKPPTADGSEVTIVAPVVAPEVQV